MPHLEQFINIINFLISKKYLNIKKIKLNNKIFPLVENIIWLVANRASRILVGIITLGAIARHLGVHDFGSLNYAISFAAIFGSLASLGLEGVVVQEQLKNPGGAQRILATSFWLRLVGGGLSMCAAFGSALILGDSFYGALLVLIVATGFLPGAFEVIELHFQKDVRAKVTVKIRFIAILISAVLKLTLVVAGAPLIWFAVMQAVEQALLAGGLWYVYRANGGKLLTICPSAEYATRFIKQSWAIVLSGLMVAVYFRSEQVVIRSLLGDTSLGLYSASSRIMELWGFVSSAIVTTAFPLLVGMKVKNPEKFRQSVQIIYDVLTWAGVAVAASVTLLAPYVVPLIFGSAFKSSIPVLIIHSWTAPVTFAASLRSMMMILEEQNHLHLPIAIGGLILYLPCTIFLTSLFGITGAAMSLLANYWITGYASSFLIPALKKDGYAQSLAIAAPIRITSIINSIKDICKA